MYIHNHVPQGVVHVIERFISQDTSIVDEDINPAKIINGGLYYGISIFCRCFIADCLSTEFLDLLDNIVRVDEVVDNDSSTCFGKC